jgi:RNA polymerase sigma-70 factor (ECF subfamily)
MQEILERHWPEMTAYAARILGAAEAADDVAQGAFVRLWQRRTRWRGDGPLRHLLFRITRNLALNERRRRERQSRWLVKQRQHPAGVAVPIDGDTPLAELLGDELQMAVARAIDALPERRRDVFVLRRYHGLAPREIARVLDISPKTVSNLLTAATDELRRSLAAYLE